MNRPMPDAKVFHGSLGAIVKALDPKTEADPMGVLASLFSYFSGAVPNRVYFESGRSNASSRPVTVWSLLVGETGDDGQKGTATGLIEKLFELVNAEWAKNHTMYGFPASGTAYMQTLTARAEAAGWGTTKEIDEKTSIFTADPGMPVVFTRPEWAMTMMHMAKDSDLAGWFRTSWESRDLDYVSAGVGRIFVERPHISIIGHISPEQFRKCLTPAALAGGDFNRMCLIYSGRSKFLPRGSDLSDMALEPHAETIRNAIAYAQDVEAVTFTEEAWSYWDTLYTEFPKVAKRNPATKWFSSRSLEYIQRLAALYALGDCRDMATLDDLIAAEMFYRYVLDSIEFVMNTGEKPATKDLLTQEEITPVVSDDEADPKVIKKLWPALKLAGELPAKQITYNMGIPKSKAIAAMAELGNVVRVIYPSTGGRRSEAYRWLGEAATEETPTLMVAEAPMEPEAAEEDTTVSELAGIFGLAI